MSAEVDLNEEYGKDNLFDLEEEPED